MKYLEVQSCTKLYKEKGKWLCGSNNLIFPTVEFYLLGSLQSKQ